MIRFFWLPAAAFVLHALVHWGWIVDDAGISFAYARNLAQGHGLVQQPGAAPVEGYSNPSWVFLLALLHIVEWFDPYHTPKIASILLVVGALGVLARALPRDTGAQRWLFSIALLLTVLNPAFVIWTTSGMENGLLVLLLCRLFRATLPPDPSYPRAAFAAALAVLAALTRPDAALYLLAWPLAVGVRGLASWRKPILVYAAVAGLLLAAFLTFRFLYFGDLLPNTYYAKAGDTASRGFVAGAAFLVLLLPTWLLGRSLQSGPDDRVAFFFLALAVAAGLHFLGAQRLLRGIAGFLGVVWLGFALAWWTTTTNPSRLTGTCALFLGIATLVFFALPKDWMGEYRFGTAAILFGYLFTAAVLQDVWAQRGIRTVPTVIIGGLVLLTLLSLFARRTWRFRQDPTVPLATTAAIHQQTFERYAKKLQLQAADASLLTPDLGGPLYFGTLRIHDLAGLTDPVIARTLYSNRASLHDHVFGQLKPGFIHVHGFWAYHAMLHEDPRFQSDYLPIVSQEDPYVARQWKLSVPAGQFVRRDLVASPEAARKLADR